MLVNGRQCDTVSLLDRGLQYGDGLFETIAVIGHEMPLWRRHYERLAKGCEALDLVIPDEQQLREEIQHEMTLCEDQSGRCVVKLIVTRGTLGHGYFPSRADGQRIIMSRPHAGLSRHERQHGIAMHLCETRLASGSPLAGMKHLNRLEQVLIAREAAKHNCREAVVCDSHGFVVEGIMSNLFWMTGNVLYTPVIDGCGVAGVMRAEVIAQAQQLAIVCQQVRVTADVLCTADAIFLTNAVNGIIAVKQLGGRVYCSSAIPAELSKQINGELMKHDD